MYVCSFHRCMFSLFAAEASNPQSGNGPKKIGKGALCVLLLENDFVHWDCNWWGTLIISGAISSIDLQIMSLRWVLLNLWKCSFKAFEVALQLRLMTVRLSLKRFTYGLMDFGIVSYDPFVLYRRFILGSLRNLQSSGNISRHLFLFLYSHLS